MTGTPAPLLAQIVIAHQVGSAAFYWAIAAELLLVPWTAALLLAPRWGNSPIRARPFRTVGFAAALGASLITLAGKTLEVWPGNPLFPSGHTAYVVVIAVFLVGRDRRSLPWVVPLLALMAVSLVLSFFHIPVDIVGGALVGLVIGIPLFRWLTRSEKRRGVTAAEAPATGVSPYLDHLPKTVTKARRAGQAAVRSERRTQRDARSAATTSSTEGRSSGPSLR